jgi:kynurenine---oxoglutarate transaminase / cysteine-S-conjugate beta-lyase / glutamine---phenylpyruvate transaminase
MTRLLDSSSVNIRTTFIFFQNKDTARMNVASFFFPSRMIFLLSFIYRLNTLFFYSGWSTTAFVPVYNVNNNNNKMNHKWNNILNRRLNEQNEGRVQTMLQFSNFHYRKNQETSYFDHHSRQNQRYMALSMDTSKLHQTESNPQSTISSTLKDKTDKDTTSKSFVSPKPTVWTEFHRLSQLHPVKANLGQGYPDWSPPTFALEALQQAANTVQNHQYTRSAGHPSLVQQLAKRYSTHLGRTIDPMTEVAITVGASQALYLALQTILQPGQEVLLLEPFFDLYVEQIHLAGGRPVYCPLTFVPYNTTTDDTVTSGNWVLEPDVLTSHITPLTKVIILNSPHNPTGKLFTYSDLQVIADAMKMAHPDCVLLSDEVYKYIVHSPPLDPLECKGQSPLCPGHIHIASLPGMWDRTLTISSAGKTFSATGWQVGWCIGPSHLVGQIQQRLPYVQFCPSTLLQEALALALPRADLPYKGFSSYYQYLLDLYTQKRSLLASALEEAGFAIPNVELTPGGGFFLLARISPAMAKQIPADRINVPNPAAPGGIARQDWALCEWLLETKGILCIPSSPFFSHPTSSSSSELVLSDQFVRIAFCKTDETIEAAANALCD